MSCCLLPPDQNSEVIKREFPIESDQRTPKITRSLSYHSLRLTSTFLHTWIHNFSRKFFHNNRLIRMVPSWVEWGGKLLCIEKAMTELDFNPKKTNKNMLHPWARYTNSLSPTFFVYKMDWSQHLLLWRMKGRGGQESLGLLDCSVDLTAGERGKNVVNEKWAAALQCSCGESEPLPAAWWPAGRGVWSSMLH